MPSSPTVREGLRLLQERRGRLEELRKEIDVGLDQVARGEVIEIENEGEHRVFFDGVKARGMKRVAGERDLE